MTPLFALDDLDAFRSSEFQTSLLVGAAALVLGALCISRRRAPGAGLLLGSVVVLAWLVADAVALDTPTRVVVGVVLLFAAGLGHDLWGLPLTLAIALASVGAWVLSDGGDYVDVSPAAALLLVVTVGAAVTAFAYIEQTAAVVLPVLVLALVGCYLTLPDTEAAVVALGAVAPLVLIAWPNVPLNLGASSSFALSGLFVHTSATGWGGRESAVVGSVGSLGVMISAPVAFHLVERVRWFWSQRDERALFLAIVLGLHAALVLLCSRVAGLRDSTAAAVVIAVVTLAAGCGALVGVAWLMERRDERQNAVIDLREPAASDAPANDGDRNLGKDVPGALADKPWE